MNENVKAFLDKKKEAERVKLEKEKCEVLIELGLYEKEYSGSDSYSNDYPLSEWDSTQGAHKYYRIVPYRVTDEEFEEIKRYTSYKNSQRSECKNGIANILKVIAWLVYIGGFIMGCVLAKGEYEFSWAVAWQYWCDSFISGTMFLGFGEVISLLEKIYNK